MVFSSISHFVIVSPCEEVPLSYHCVCICVCCSYLFKINFAKSVFIKILTHDRIWDTSVSIND